MMRRAGIDAGARMTGRRIPAGSGRLAAGAAAMLLLAAFGLAFAGEAYAQVRTDRQQLQRMSEQLSEQWQQQRSQTLQRARELNLPVRIELDDGRVAELQRFDDGHPVYVETHNLTAAATSSVDALWPGAETGLDLSGEDITLGIWDAGAVRESHQELQGRVEQIDGATNLNTHATHVAGTMMAAGVEEEARGMAFEAQLHAHDWNSDLSQMYEAAAEGLVISNHSYGLIMGWHFDSDDSTWRWYGDIEVSETEDISFGYYGALTRLWDEFAYEAPHYLVVKSAGNSRLQGPSSQPVEHEVWDPDEEEWVISTTQRDLDGGPDGFTSLGGRAVAKNVLSVAAVHSSGGQEPGTYEPQTGSFSSMGPTDDGRIKPELSAQGVDVYSPTAEGTSAYRGLTGTSMAAPVVSGAAGLLQQHYRQLYQGERPYASTLRALLLHTTDRAGGHEGPDYVFGWGLMNARRAAELLSESVQFAGEQHVQELVLEEGQQLELQVESDGETPLRATIAWTDPPGSVPTQKILNNEEPALVNDLDLRVHADGGATYRPWVLDASEPGQLATTGDNIVDNVEQVYVEDPEAGGYTIALSHKDGLEGGSQQVSLILSGVTMEKAALSASETMVSEELDAGMMGRQTLTFENHSDDDLTAGLSILYSGDEQDWLEVQPDEAELPAGEQLQVDLDFDAGDVWDGAFDAEVILDPNHPDFDPLAVPVQLQVSPPHITGFSLQMEEGYPELSWQVSSDVSVDRYRIERGASSGDLAPYDSTATDEKQFTDTDLQDGLRYYTVTPVNDRNQTGGTSEMLAYFQSQRTLEEQWKLLSVPVDGSTVALDSSRAFRYDRAYTSVDRLTSRNGYWVKSEQNEQLRIQGEGLQRDTLALRQGWNMIGSLADSLSVDAIKESSNLLADQVPVYGYSASGYETADMLLAGRGYWVFAATEGDLVLDLSFQSVDEDAELDEAPVAGRADRVEDQDVPPAELVFSSGGVQQRIWAYESTLDEQTRRADLLPPVAPDPVLDVRTADGYRSGARDQMTLHLQAAEYPVRIALGEERGDPDHTYVLIGETGDGGREEIPLSRDGSVNLDRSYQSITLQQVEKEQEVDHTTMKANFPNPFNATTTIEYQLQKPAHVELRVYNTLGRPVATLVDEQQDAGEYQAIFDASGMPSGMYIVRFRAGEHNHVQKMTVVNE